MADRIKCEKCGRDMDVSVNVSACNDYHPHEVEVSFWCRGRYAAESVDIGKAPCRHFFKIPEVADEDSLGIYIESLLVRLQEGEVRYG